MGDVATKEGRTVLFVSHNMGIITQICKQCIWLKEGKKELKDYTKIVIKNYLSSSEETRSQVLLKSNSHKLIQYTKITILDETENISSEISDTEKIKIALDVEVRKKVHDIYFGIVLKNNEGINVLFADSRDGNGNFPSSFEKGSYTFYVVIPPLLAPGEYMITAGIASTSLYVYDYQDTICSFSLVNLSTNRFISRPGFINLNLSWEFKRQNNEDS